MITETVRLKTGEELVIQTLQPPLHDYVSKVGCWSDVRDDLLNGELTEWLFTPYFVGEIDGEVVGSMSYYTPNGHARCGCRRICADRRGTQEQRNRLGTYGLFGPEVSCR